MTTPDDPNHDEFARFWLVLADQFQKRGIQCSEAISKAVDVIDSDRDLTTLAAMGMPDSSLAKRAAVLRDLRARLLAAQSPRPRPRKTLQRPQRLVMQRGEVLVYPTSGGAPYNPFVTSAERDLFETAHDWEQDGWGALLVLKAERAFDYLAWYSTLVIRKELPEKPTLDMLTTAPWTQRPPGTCSPSQFKRLRLEPIATISLRHGLLERISCSANRGARAALLDASLASYMDIASDHPKQNVHIQERLNAMPAIRMKDIADISHVDLAME